MWVDVVKLDCGSFFQRNSLFLNELLNVEVVLGNQEVSENGPVVIPLFLPVGDVVVHNRSWRQFD